MAFNFNWTPLTADPSFYTRAQELLTGALNKYPKPPIIVDDILVNELNLGSVPPDLEILEVGDLAEDRFRGIFKMRYSGDAFLTLKTRVQANPLNTYLSTRPSFASPEPLAAAAGLTIPLKITLSDIKLSAFIILVFSKQKGLTLVFRNDPLESLKVSSTFDSIPFVRDYLQRTIEGQLRSLLMDEVPAIIHRLSLRLWVPEYRAKEDSEAAREKLNQEFGEDITDPFASPPQDPVDLNGQVLDASQIASLSLDSGAEAQSLFSRKNLIRMATLCESQRTLSLFTPSMQDVVYRAWPGPPDRAAFSGFQSPRSPSLSRTHSMIASPTTNIFSAASEAGSHSTRPTLASFGSSFTSTGHPKHGRARKRKHRVINLRRSKTDANLEDGANSVSGDSATVSSGTSEAGFSAPPILEERDMELSTPPLSPQLQKDPLQGSPSRLAELTPRPPIREKQPASNPPYTASAPAYTPSSSSVPHPLPSAPMPDRDGPRLHHTQPQRQPRPQLQNRYFQSFPIPPTTNQPQDEPATSHPHSHLPSSHIRASSPISSPSHFLAAPFPFPLAEAQPGGILEQAWMMKMAGEIARRMQEQRLEQRIGGGGGGSSAAKNVSGPWSEAGPEAEREMPPPAYGA